MAKIAYEALDEKKGEAIKVIDISQISVIADYFIITNGTSDSQVKATGRKCTGKTGKSRSSSKADRRK